MKKQTDVGEGACSIISFNLTRQLRRRALSTTALSLFSAALFSAAPLAAFAQVDEIVVSAQKKSESANDVGITLSAFTGDTLNDRGVEDTTDIAALVPGFTFTDVGFGPPVYTMRGVGFKDTSFNAAATVGVYLDEAAIAYPIMTLGSVFDLERVEVLKGPQGTLYGRNNTGGAINYIGVKPTDEFAGGVRASYGRFQTFDIEGFVSGPVSDSVRARVAFTKTKSGKGWQINSVTGEDLGELDKTALRLTVEADLTEKFDAMFQLGWWEDQSEGTSPQAVAPGFQAPGNTPIVNIETPWITAFTPSRSNREAGFAPGQDLRNNKTNIQGTLRLNYRLNDALTATSISSLAAFDDEGSRRDIGGFAVPFDASVAPFVQSFANAQDWPWIPNFLIENVAEIRTFSQELRLAGDHDGFSWIAGLYYADDKVDSKVLQEVLLTTNTNNFGPGGIFNIRSAGQDGVSQTRTYGVFGNANIDLTSALRLNLGVRYSDDKNDYVYCARDTDGIFGPQVFGQPAGACLTLLAPGVRGQVIDSLSEDSVSIKASLDWFVTDDVLLFGGYSRGFKAGSFPNQLAFLAPQVAPAVQEELNSFEVGFKATLAGGAIQLNGAGYYNFYTDKQLIGVVVDPQFGALRRLVNVPEAVVRGVELDMQFNSGNGLFGSLSGAYTDTEITEDFVGPDAFARNINYGGSKFTETADFQANALLGYERPVGGGLFASIEGDVAYSSSVNFDFEPGTVIAGVTPGAPTSLDPNFRADDYFTLNARASLGPEDERWRLTFWARNLTDEFYVTGVRKALDAVTQFTGKPRTYGATVEFNF